MQAVQTAAGAGATALALSVVVGMVYLTIVRFLDLNEKEPLWTTALVFVMGVVSATYLHLVASSPFLELNFWGGILTRELVLFATVSLGVAVLAAIGRLRGWSEISGVMDGVVYGAAAGFGFATGTTFVRELLFAGTGDLLGQSAFAQLWPVALVGLSIGVFGAIIGAGWGAAAGARSAGARIGYPILGLVGAIGAHALYQYLRLGTPAEAVALKWLGLLLPVAAIAAVIVAAIVHEQKAIAAELADEAEAGVVSAEELALLRSFAARRGAYLRRLLAGDFDGWLQLRELHNRQVQLALAERRFRHAESNERRETLGAEVARLRASVLALKQQRPAIAVADTVEALS